MYEAVITEKFRAIHSIDTVREEPHPHEWVVRVTIAADKLVEPGFIINYYDLRPLVRELLPVGKNMNELFDFTPTAENLARHFYQQLKPRLPQLKSVSVGEFEAFMCTYSES